MKPAAPVTRMLLYFIFAILFYFSVLGASCELRAARVRGGELRTARVRGGELRTARGRDASCDWASCELHVAKIAKSRPRQVAPSPSRHVTDSISPGFCSFSLTFQ